MNTSTHYRQALVAQVTLLLYFEVCVLVPLGRWNDQPGMEKAFAPGNLILGGMIAVAQSLLLLGTIRRLHLLLWLGLIGDTVWLIMHGGSLWTPYIFGASPQYAQMYARVFSRTTKLLPSFGNHLAPDAMHMFIDVLLVAVIVTLYIYIRSLRRDDRARPAPAAR